MKREYNFSAGKRGPVLPAPTGKTRITIRIDSDVIDWFRRQVNEAGGGNYQSLINTALRQHIQRTEEPLEVVLRRVIREELPQPRARSKAPLLGPSQGRARKPNPALQRTR